MNALIVTTSKAMYEIRQHSLNGLARFTMKKLAVFYTRPARNKAMRRCKDGERGAYALMLIPSLRGVRLRFGSYTTGEIQSIISTKED